ncbi:MAG: FeoB-associated Cys-rich membrane protein [Flavobacteriaceae bacterium]|nr:FeoB-associated Cys-rich membrane protein [Flavobacteriaceae bacterium]
MQQILVYIALGIAILFLVRKYFFKSKNKGGGCDTDCGC